MCKFSITVKCVCKRTNLCLHHKKKPIKAGKIAAILTTTKQKPKSQTNFNPIQIPTYDLRQRQQNNEQSTPSHHSTAQQQQPASSDCINRRRNHALKCKLLLCSLFISNLNHKPEVFIHSAWTRTRLSPSALLRLAASALRDHRQWTKRQNENTGTRRRTAEE